MQLIEVVSGLIQRFARCLVEVIYNCGGDLGDGGKWWGCVADSCHRCAAMEGMLQGYGMYKN